MNTASWVAIYVPIYILFFVILPQQRKLQQIVIGRRIVQRKELHVMANELINKFIGKTCKISTGSFGTTLVGTLIDVNENWLEVETKKGRELINADYIQSIKVNPR